MMDENELNACFGGVEDGEAQWADVDGDAFAWEGFEGVEEVPGQGVVLVVFGDVEVEFFVEALDLGSAGNFVVAVGEAAVVEALAVVLVFNLAEDFFDEVFEGDESGGAAEFVDYDGHGLLLCEHALHDGVGEHALRGEQDGLDACAPVGVGVEEFGDVYVADDVVDVLAVNDDFAESGGNECVY